MYACVVCTRGRLFLFHNLQLLECEGVLPLSARVAGYRAAGRSSRRCLIIQTWIHFQTQRQRGRSAHGLV